MSRTYKATGIILKGMPLGESDRLVTILTPELGLIRAVVPGARKQHSRLRGRSELFVVNELLVAKGRSLPKITQAETLESYPGLSKNLGKLAASQYLAELVLCFALSEQPQVELYELLNEHLRRLEQLNNTSYSLILAHLSQGIFHLLALAGLGLQVQSCVLSQQPVKPDFSNPNWRIGFSLEAGGIVNITPFSQNSPVRVHRQLNAVEVTLLQQLASLSLPRFETILPESLHDSVNEAWIRVERLLRDNAQYHFGKLIRSATLVDTLVL